MARKMMTDDPKSIVTTGYDLIAEGYLEPNGCSQVRDQWLGKLITLLPAKSRVLDLGCGPWRGSWLGVEMFSSHYGAEVNEQLVRRAGFDIEEAAVVVA
jgi:hypothetical protein